MTQTIIPNTFFPIFDSDLFAMAPLFRLLVLLLALLSGSVSDAGGLKRDECTIQSSPKNEALGDKASKSGDWENARKYYQAAIDENPETPGLYYKYGGVLAMISSKDNWAALSNLGDMRRAFETCIRLDPKHIEAHWALVEYYLQVPGLLGGSESKATSYAVRLSALSAVDGVLAKARIAEYYQRDKVIEAMYLEAIHKFNSPSAREKLKAYYLKKGKKQAADALDRKSATSK